MMKRKSNLYLIIIVTQLLNQDIFAQNRLDSRIFYDLPNLHDSYSHFSWRKLYPIKVFLPDDRRLDFYGETAYKRIKVQDFKDFWKQSITLEIQKKIIKDLHLQSFNLKEIENSNLAIYPIIEVFYPDVRGFIWGKSFAKVRLHFKVIDKENKILLDNKYESFYISSGLDSEWEGKVAETIENGANITIGIALRKALDSFYNDLDRLL